ncbi:MAG: type 1 glutamine amidotransferase [Bdellovibrionia bacterium]
MNVLIIDSTIDRTSWGSADLRESLRLLPDLRITTRRAPEQDLPESLLPFDRIVLSGSKTSAQDDSPWVHALLNLICSAVDLKKPLLGVCFGHQMIARALGGKRCVRRSSTPEVGWSKIQITQPSDLLRELGSSFYSFSSHFDEVCELPPNAVALASSERCAIQAFGLQHAPIYGIQFHPEKTPASAEQTFHERRNHRDLPLLHPKKSQELYNPEVARRLFTHFLTLPVSSGKSHL